MAKKSIKSIVAQSLREIKKVLASEGYSLAFDWDHGTLVAGDAGLRWNPRYDGEECSAPKGFEGVTEKDTWDYYKNRKLLPDESVMYVNDESHEYFVKEPVKGLAVSAVKGGTGAIAKARSIAHDMLKAVTEAGCSLYHEYGDGHVGIAEGRLVMDDDDGEGEEWYGEGEICAKCVVSVCGGDTLDTNELIRKCREP